MRLIVFMVLIIAGFLFPVYATTISTDKSSYQSGDSIVLAGSVGTVDDGQFISVQILNPSKSDFVQIDTFAPDPDGSFFRIYKADGSKWNTDGTYTLKLFYNQDNFQTTFEFDTNTPPEPEPEHTSEQKPTASKQEQESKPIQPKKEQEPLPEQKLKVSPQSKPNEKEMSSSVTQQEPKTHIPGFPALNISPQYYYDRYDDEETYQDWFDSQFPDKPIQNVVGYASTHVPGFPDESKSPEHYINRYNNEPSYQDWFDSQFPGKSLYDIMGFPEPLSIPEWIKNNAQWWATGEIQDDDFILGLQFMIENNIVVIDGISESNSNAETIPDWIRNNASWWAQEKISEEEFVNGIRYLITNGIIIVN